MRRYTAYILAIVAGTAPEQSAGVIRAITVTTLVVPTLFFAVGTVVFAMLYKIDKRTLEEMNAELSKKREKVSIDAISG